MAVKLQVRTQFRCRAPLLSEPPRPHENVARMSNGQHTASVVPAARKKTYPLERADWSLARRPHDPPQNILINIRLIEIANSTPMCGGVDPQSRTVTVLGTFNFPFALVHRGKSKTRSLGERGSQNENFAPSLAFSVRQRRGNRHCQIECGKQRYLDLPGVTQTKDTIRSPKLSYSLALPSRSENLPREPSYLSSLSLRFDSPERRESPSGV